MELFLNAAHDNILEEIPKAEKVIFCEDKSDTFSQTEEIEAEQLVGQAQPSLHQPPSWWLEVTELVEPIFRIAQASLSILRNCQQWVTSTILPSTLASIPDFIIQPLPNNQVATKFPIETAIVNITNGRCPLLFINNTPNSIKLRPNQLLAAAKHTLEPAAHSIDFQVATTTLDCDLTNHEPAPLDKLLPCHTDKQKLEFALNKMTQQTRITAAQKTKALRAALTAQPMPNFQGYTLVGFDTKSIMAGDMKNLKFAVPMPADSMASSYPGYV
uniref:Uncharacterized protein n=1 Tax=Romanomermis culicivorax TaxID=13658 RepID=A0A915KHV9_ROMCU